MGDSSIAIAPASHVDVFELAGDMRCQDIDEVRALGYASPLEALEASVKDSAECWSVRLGGELAFIFGVSPTPDGGGLVWMLSGEPVERHKEAFRFATRAAVEGLLLRWPVLRNVIDARYVRALRWAAWLGFTLEEPVLLGPEKLPFVPVSIGGA